MSSQQHMEDFKKKKLHKVSPPRRNTNAHPGAAAAAHTSPTTKLSSRTVFSFLPAVNAPSLFLSLIC